MEIGLTPQGQPGGPVLESLSHSAWKRSPGKEKEAADQPLQS
jgi:hypothetical protein